MPPFFGVSSAGAASGGTPKSAANRASLIFITSSCSTVLFIEPDRRQILIDEVGWADLEALHVRPVRHDPVPPQYPDHMGRVIEHVLFEPAHKRPLLRRIGLAQQLFVKVDL